MPYGDDAPYDLSRSAMRRKFGARKVDASAPPSDRNSRMLELPTPPQGGMTPARNWNSFFRPVTPETSMFSAGTMGVTGGDKAATMAATPTPIPTPAVAAPALPAAPVNYLKSAFDKATQFWNAQGGRMAAPMPGAVAAGTSFRNRYGTGSVASASENKLRRLLKETPMPELFDLSDV